MTKQYLAIAMAHGEVFANFVLKADCPATAYFQAEKVIEKQFFYDSYSLQIKEYAHKLPTLYSLVDLCNGPNPEVKQVTKGGLFDYLRDAHKNAEVDTILANNPSFEQLDELTDGMGILIEVIRP